MADRIIAADIGSTTTKTALFERADGAWRLVGKMVAPTTVEAPDLDVMIGLRNAISKLERRTGRKLLDGRRLISPCSGDEGVDAFLATSSAGGGLQMLVTGLVKNMTAESAHRAALGAGAVVTDILSLDDDRVLMERIEAVKKIRPDMVLITGGTDGGNISEVAAIAEYVGMANPKPRFGEDFKVPVIFAGNVDARGYVEQAVGDSLDLSFADNIRPKLEQERLDDARQEIHRLYLEHVMMRAPGYKTLVEWAQGEVKPTPVAFGEALSHLAKERDGDVLGVDIGGATTDVFSVIAGSFYRTVSANLGMSYSTGNVLAEAKVESVERWLPWEPDQNTVRNWDFNKMIRPTTLPQTLDELLVEQAIAREALRLSLEHHRSLIRGLKGIHLKRMAGEVFQQFASGATLVDMMAVGLLVGSGGAFSYAPRRAQAAWMMLDAFGPVGVTELAVDSQFMLPHIGALMGSHPEVAVQLMEEALAPIGTVIAPAGPAASHGSVICRVETDNGSYQIFAGEISVIKLGARKKTTVTVTPKRDLDVGAGKGKPLTQEVSGGEVGIILDGRSRPLTLPQDAKKRIALLRKWARSLDAYSEEALEGRLARRGDE